MAGDFNNTKLHTDLALSWKAFSLWNYSKDSSLIKQVTVVSFFTSRESSVVFTERCLNVQGQSGLSYSASIISNVLCFIDADILYETL